MLDQALVAAFQRSVGQVSPRAQDPIWPVPAFEGRTPTLVNHVDTSPGVLIALARRSDVDLVDRFPIGTSRGTAAHFLPNRWPALAVGDGVIIHAKSAHVGNFFSIVVDHQNGWATFYGNLGAIFATRTDRRVLPRREIVRRGDALGFIAGSEPSAFQALYFELWRLRSDEAVVEPVDPRPYLASWLVASRHPPARSIDAPFGGSTNAANR